MIRNANELTSAERAALETLLGRRVQDDEAVSLRTFEPAKVSDPQRKALADKLRDYLAEVDATRKPSTEQEREDAIHEAMRSVRPSYRDRR